MVVGTPILGMLLRLPQYVTNMYRGQTLYCATLGLLSKSISKFQEQQVVLRKPRGASMQNARIFKAEMP